MNPQTSVAAIFTPDLSHNILRPLFLVPVAAGFPSPAEDYVELKLDLNKHLIPNPASTYFVRTQGDSMIGAGIHDGDILIVDRSIEPVSEKIVIAVVNGEMLVKRIRWIEGRVYLVPDNDNYPSLLITEEMNFEVWGVVTNVVHNL